MQLNLTPMPTIPLAEYVDAGTENNYWKSWLATIRHFDQRKATDWLLAQAAEESCKAYHLTAFSAAELYGAWGLQLLQSVGDARRQLDIKQRLMIILYQFQGLCDLAYAFARQTMAQAESLKYHLRAVGMVYNYASALFLAGNNYLALKKFELTIQSAKNLKQVPFISWYQAKGIVGKALVYWRLSDYEKVLLMCKEIENGQFDANVKIDLHNLRGLVYKGLGNYDRALTNYEQMFKLAIAEKDDYHQIIALNNIGSLYYLLAEYELADYYHDQAMKLLEEYNPENLQLKGSLLISLAELKAGQKDSTGFNELIEASEKIMKTINIPTVKAQFLRSFGQLNLKLERYQQAVDYFNQAIAVYEEAGLLRAAMETKVSLVESLIGISQYDEAERILNELYALAIVRQYHQGQVDALGFMAELAQGQGNLEQAVHLSNQLTHKIEQIIRNLNDKDNLTIFCQKVHPYLRNAVRYELARNRVDSAFVKLDYLKAWALRTGLRADKNGDSVFNWKTGYINIAEKLTQLGNTNLILSYFLTPDTLYAFLLGHNQFKLLKKPHAKSELKKLVNAYLDSINSTIKVFENYASDIRIDNHYQSVDSLSQRLYQNLLDWPDLQLALQSTWILYIIADDFLYSVPFGCLRNTENEESPFLVQQTAVVNLPSVYFFQPTSQPPPSEKMLISVDCNLPGAKTFLKHIKSIFPHAQELAVDQSDFSKADVLARLNRGYQTYIFLGHSEANTNIPDMSTFHLAVLNQSNSSPELLKTSLADFKQVDWTQSEMVFLIGCGTANGKVYQGTGLSGISQGILMSGARQVLASLWKIDAARTNALMCHLLKYMSQYCTATIALQKAQIETIKDLQNDKIYRHPHPFLWGGLTLSLTTHYY